MCTKKILILSSFGGYGHIAAANTIRELLGSEYQIDVIYPIKELRIWGIPSGESFYNFLISKNWTRLTNWIVRLFPARVFERREQKMARLIEKHIEEKQPDLIISLIPFVNYPATEAARKYDLPFLLVTTDNDLENWVYGLEKLQLSDFKVTIGSDLPTSKNTLLEKLISEDCIETIGLPLRPSFLNPQSKELIRQEYEIPQNRNVLLIMMGGIGASASYQYAKVIAQSSLNVHLIVCVGKNSAMAPKLKKIKVTQGNSIDIVPFTENVHELFAVADVILTKSGPGTINEALALKLPILIDITQPPLFWEEPNIEFVQNFKIGACIHSYKEAPRIIHQYLYDEQLKEEIANAYERIPENQFANRISPLIKEMCQETLAGEVAVTARKLCTK